MWPGMPFPNLDGRIHQSLVFHWQCQCHGDAAACVRSAAAMDTPTLLATPASDVVVTEPPGPGPGLGRGRGPGSTIGPGATVLYEFECHVTAVAHRRDKSKLSKSPKPCCANSDAENICFSRCTFLLVCCHRTPGPWSASCESK